MKSKIAFLLMAVVPISVLAQTNEYYKIVTTEYHSPYNNRPLHGGILMNIDTDGDLDVLMYQINWNTWEPTPAFKVYPNPTTGMLTLEFTQNSGRKTEVSVSNIIGAEVFRKEFTYVDKLQIDLSNQVSGIYLLKVIAEGQQYTNKVVIRKE